MLKTKLLSVFVAFALIVTVGGVYATWNYAEGAMGKLEYVTDGRAILDLADRSDSTNTKGSLSFTTASLTVSIDDPITVDDPATLEVEEDVKHKAELSFSGSIVITFTPHENASVDIKENGVKLQFELSNNDALVWPGLTGSQIFVINETPVVCGQDIVVDEDTTIDVGDLVKQSDGSFTWEISAELIDYLIDLRAEDIILDTVAKYDEFDLILSKNKIALTFSEYTA